MNSRTHRRESSVLRPTVEPDTIGGEDIPELVLMAVQGPVNTLNRLSLSLQAETGIADAEPLMSDDDPVQQAFDVHADVEETGGIEITKVVQTTGVGDTLQILEMARPAEGLLLVSRGLTPSEPSLPTDGMRAMLEMGIEDESVGSAG